MKGYLHENQIEILFRHEKMFTWLFIAGELKLNFVLGVVGAERPFKNVNKPEWDIETTMFTPTLQEFTEEVLR